MISIKKLLKEEEWSGKKAVVDTFKKVKKKEAAAIFAKLNLSDADFKTIYYALSALNQRPIGSSGNGW